jgi:hypothetical protein
MIRGRAQDQPADPAKAINSNLRHRTFLLDFLQPDAWSAPRPMLIDETRPAREVIFDRQR